jgi:hypothetical protein
VRAMPWAGRRPAAQPPAHVARRSSLVQAAASRAAGRACLARADAAPRRHRPNGQWL